LTTKPFIHHALQEKDFSHEEQYRQLQSACPESGAIVTFSGLVRDVSKNNNAVECIELQCYQAMTSQQIEQIAHATCSNFDIDGISIIHRFGKLKPTEQIVFVGAASKHRLEAFSAAQMAMDFLKSKVAFWKKEFYQDQSPAKWIEPTLRDQTAIDDWLKKTIT